MIKYYTAFKEARVEQVIDKSRFIGSLNPVKTKDEADMFFDYIRKKYRDATHNVPAFVIGENMEFQWASDDGEPQGTSGAPMVRLLVNKKITNVAVMVTRYFGGIKLGTGGLVKAYKSTAEQALNQSGIAAVKVMTNILIAFDYTYLGKIKNLVYEGDFSIRNLEYLEKVQATIVTDPEKRDGIIEKIMNISSGSASIILESNMDEKVKISL